ncbi:MAG: 3-oxoadipate enol-lactonase [Desulfobacteraceae bacterium]|nr:MAG: 3-oxoadipate enol-lactonase [Desulfobacteraceae bacterium]
MKIYANGITMHYELEGPESAPVVSLSHSLATDLSMWDLQAAVLKSGYRVLRYDTRGHGCTDAPEGPYTLEQLADDAKALLQALHISKTHFMGISMGGMIGQVLALKDPGLLRSLILCDTSSRIPEEALPVWEERIGLAQQQGMDALVESTMERWFTAPFRAKPIPVLEKIRGMIRTTPLKGYIGCSRAIMKLNLTERLTEIELPTLIVVGEEDPGTPVAASQAIHKQIKGSELVILKSAAHLSNIEQQDAFNTAVLDFLRRRA